MIMKKGLTEIVFILDRSGSMHGLEADTIGGFNSMMEKQKKNSGDDGEAYVSTVLFDDFSRVLHDRIPIENVPEMTDNDYYVNSFHVDVKEPITITEKIKREAPFHAITRGGHITYVELDGEAQKNVKAIAKIVKVMHDEGIGYGSINHPVDTCQACGYKGVIYDKCPVCQSENIMRMRRITGYLTGDLSTWNSAKRAEERDRVKHG